MTHPNRSESYMLCSETAPAATSLLSCAGDVYDNDTVMDLDGVDDFDWFLPDMTAPSSPVQS